MTSAPPPTTSRCDGVALLGAKTGNTGMPSIFKETK